MQIDKTSIVLGQKKGNNCIWRTIKKRKQSVTITI